MMIAELVMTLALVHQTPVLAFAPPAIHAKAHGSPQRQTVTPLLGLCDAAGVLDVLGDLSDADTAKKRNQIALLAGRIIDCSRKLRSASASVPVPSATPFWVAASTAPPVPHPADPVCLKPPPATMASNRFALYEILGRCAADWMALSAPPTPIPNATSVPSMASRPTFYVFATGSVDPATTAVLIRSAVGRLTAAQHRAWSVPARGNADAPGDIVVSGRADWTSADSFAAQCQLDPNTRGALIIGNSIPETYRNNYFLLVANFTTVSASVEILGCGAQDHTAAAAPLSIYHEHAVTGKSHQDALTLGIFSSIATFLATNKTKTTVTSGGGTTTITKSDSSAPAFSGSVLAYFEGENLNLPAQNASVQLAVAADRFADGVMTRLRDACTAPEIVRLADAANPERSPPPPLEHRSPRYEAAFEYIDDCTLFANFGPRP